MKVLNMIKNLLKKKRFYIVVMVIATILLIADIAVFAVSSSNRGMNGQMGNRSFNSEDFDSDSSDKVNLPDSSEMPDMSDGDMPDMRNDSDESVNTGDTEASDDSAASEDVETTDDNDSSDDDAALDGSNDSQESEDTDGSTALDGSSEDDMMAEGNFSREDRNTDNFDNSMGNSGSGRIACIIIGIICLLIDIACVVRLVLMVKKEKKDAKESTIGEDAHELTREEQEAKYEQEIEEKVRKRSARKKRNAIIAVVMAVILVVVIILSQALRKTETGSSSEINEELVLAEVETGDIENKLYGTGSLTTSEASEITIPGDITIEEYEVSNGDTVEEGDAIATVNKTSVMNAISELQEVIDELDAEIEDSLSEEIDSKIDATADGEVVAVYAAADDSVIDVMYEYGALALVSLDGLLSVEIETTESLTIGDEVNVRSSDGDECEGNVTSVSNGTYTITVSLDDMDYQDTVSVETTDGTEIGSGTLEIYSLLKITGYMGTISSVSVTAGDSVEAEDTLFELDDISYSATYMLLLDQREELEEQLQELMQAYETGKIYATESGIISGISTSSDSDTSDDSSEEESAENTDSGESENSDTSDVSVNIEQNTSATVMATSATYSATALSTTDGDNLETTNEETTTDENTEEESSSGSSSDSSGSGSSSSGSSTDSGSSSSGSSSSSSSSSGSASSSNSSDSSSSLSGSNSGSNSNDESSSQYGTNGSISGNSVTGDSSGQSAESGSDMNTSQSEMSDMESEMSDEETEEMMEEAETDEESEEEAEEIAETYSISETSVCSITPDDEMTISITVDELDILSIYEGQNAEVTLDALMGQSFEAVVESIDTNGTNSGGNTKYTVDLTISKTEDMLSGMNASVSISLETKTDVVIIPEAALEEDGNSVYVYTEYDEETDTLGSPVEVTCGLSDGTNVEITEGLSAGDTYYYKYADTIVNTFSS